MPTCRDLEISTTPMERAIIERIPSTTKSGSFEIDKPLLDLSDGDLGGVFNAIHGRISKLGASVTISREPNGREIWVNNFYLVEWCR